MVTFECVSECVVVHVQHALSAASLLRRPGVIEVVTNLSDSIETAANRFAVDVKCGTSPNTAMALLHLASSESRVLIAAASKCAAVAADGTLLVLSEAGQLLARETLFPVVWGLRVHPCGWIIACSEARFVAVDGGGQVVQDVEVDCAVDWDITQDHVELKLWDGRSVAVPFLKR